MTPNETWKTNSRSDLAARARPPACRPSAGHPSACHLPPSRLPALQPATLPPTTLPSDVLPPASPPTGTPTRLSRSPSHLTFQSTRPPDGLFASHSTPDCYIAHSSASLPSHLFVHRSIDSSTNAPYAHQPIRSPVTLPFVRLSIFASPIRPPTGHVMLLYSC